MAETINNHSCFLWRKMHDVTHFYKRNLEMFHEKNMPQTKEERVRFWGTMTKWPTQKLKHTVQLHTKQNNKL